MKRKVMELYEEQVCKNFNDNDLWYNRIIVNIDRLLKILAAQTTSIDSVERKINNLSVRHKKDQQKHDNKMITDNSGLTNNQFGQQMDLNKDMFETATLGNFPRVEDDHLSSSSEEER